jgi:hypothetical protein
MDKRQRLIMLGIAAAVVVVAAVIAIASSGGSDDKDKSTSTAATSTTPSKPAPEQIQVKGGQPDGGVKKIELNKNEQAEIDVDSDQKLPIHFHGYDIEKDAAPGKPAVFRFKADKEGVFEMEVESSSTKIADITVKP